MKPKNILLALLLVVCVPSLAHANVAISFLGVVTAFHLFAGNAALDLIEGNLLTRFFGIANWKSVSAMVPANYFSSWAGFFICNWIVDKLLWVDIYNARFIFEWMVGFAYLLTLALEGPFVFFLLFKRDPRRWISSLKASMLMQTTTYILLLIFYAGAGVRILDNNLSIVPLAEITPPYEALLYYISEDGDSVCAQNLDSMEKRIVYDLPSRSLQDHLYTRSVNTASTEFEIVARLETGPPIQTEHLIVDKVKDVTGELRWHSPNQRNPAEEPTCFICGATPLLGSFRSEWSFNTNFYGNEGIKGENRIAREPIRFAVLTHFFSWSARNAVQLPGDYVVFQLGDDQICLIDANAKKIALVVRGRGPMVVLKGNTKDSRK